MIGRHLGRVGEERILKEETIKNLISLEIYEKSLHIISRF